MSQATNAVLYYGFDFFTPSDEALDERLEKKFERIVDLAQNCEIPKKLGVTVDCHCSSSYPVWFLAVTDVMVTATRGDPHVIDMTRLAAMDSTELDGKLKEFCHQYGVPWQRPSWHLASYWEV